jgi:hypothetical protein
VAPEGKVTDRRFVPKPGSVADRVIKHLRTLPEGQECTAAELGEACGFHRKQAVAFLTPAVNGGALVRRITEDQGRMPSLYFSLGKGVRIATADPKPAHRIQSPLRGSVFEVSPARRFDPAVEPPPPDSFLEQWRRLRGESQR